MATHYPPAKPPCSAEQLNPSTVSDALAEILKRLLALYEAAGKEPPKRRIWSLGSVPEDCDELVVAMVDIAPDEGQEPNCDTTMRMTVMITVTRCVPVSATKSGDRPPTPFQMAKAGTILGADAWILAKAPGCLDLYGMGGLNASVVVDEAQGGMQSVSMNFSLVV